jgi:hypothetical protein
MPMCLKKHVSARGRLVHILPQMVQANFALWDVDWAGVVMAVVIVVVVMAVGSAETGGEAVSAVDG